jgi:DNA (cytosine-5)-methyltransferase 1
MSREIKVVELFAGVGGFRIGLEGWEGKSALSNFSEGIDSNFKIVWSNQWEPSTKTQFASIVYEKRFGKDSHSNLDISIVKTEEIPDHDLLVGGFPCQDYSVATTLNNSKGINGKKGVLWWSIYRIIEEKLNKPKILFLENVDRLLISPSKNRGRDFAIILQSLNKLGYVVEWRVINAADYGMPQKRKRVFILAYLKGSKIFNQIDNSYEWLLETGTIAKAFPIYPDSLSQIKQFQLNNDLFEISESFNIKNEKKFENTGIMIDGNIITFKSVPLYKGKVKLLSDVLVNDTVVNEEYIISESEIKKWEYLKNSKNELRTNKSGILYKYNEGAMPFPDSLDKPSRTIITGEGGKSPSRFKHVIYKNNILRRLYPIELERLNMFPDNHTNIEGISDSKRAFFMGNALVVGIVEKIGKELYTQLIK